MAPNVNTLWSMHGLDPNLDFFKIISSLINIFRESLMTCQAQRWSSETSTSFYRSPHLPKCNEFAKTIVNRVFLLCLKLGILVAPHIWDPHTHHITNNQRWDISRCQETRSKYSFKALSDRYIGGILRTITWICKTVIAVNLDSGIFT